MVEKDTQTTGREGEEMRKEVKEGGVKKWRSDLKE